MESLGYKQKNKMVYQMIENMKQKSIDFDQFLDMMTARIVRAHSDTCKQACKSKMSAAARGGTSEREEKNSCVERRKQALTVGSTLLPLVLLACFPFSSLMVTIAMIS